MLRFGARQGLNLDFTRLSFEVRCWDHRWRGLKM